MSDKIWRIIMVCRYRFKDKIWNKRFFYTGGVFIILIYMIEEGVRKFAVQTGVKITPFAFPFLSGDWICQMLITGYYLWIVSALCEERESDLFIKARAGKTFWKSGNCLAVVKTAFVYTLCLAVVSTIIFLPYLEFSTDWGEVWNTLARTNAGDIYNVGMLVSSVVIHLYTPVEALVYAVILQFLCLCFMGMILFLINTLTKKIIGNFVALGMVFLDVMLSNTSQERFFKFSPITLAQISNYSIATKKYGIDFMYAIKFYIAGVVIFCFMSVFTFRKIRRRQNEKCN